MIRALRTASCAVFAHARRGRQIVRARSEPILGVRQCTHGADLDGVSREVGVERLGAEDADLLHGTAFEQLDGWITGNLRREASTSSAQDTAFAIEQNLGRQRNRFGIRTFGLGEPGLGATRGHRLILQWTLTALVAHRAIERMIDQQQFHDATLRFARDLRRHLSAHHHALGHGRRTGRQRLALPLDIDQTLAAGTHRIEQRVIAESRNLYAHQLGRANHQRALGNTDLVVVDGQCHHLYSGDRLIGIGRSGACGTTRGCRSGACGATMCCCSHDVSSSAIRVDRCGSKGHPCSVT